MVNHIIDNTFIVLLTSNAGPILRKIIFLYNFNGTKEKIDK